MGKYGFFNTYEYGVHQKIVNYIDSQKKVLDIGCAEGDLSREMKINECKIVGIELDEQSAQIAKQFCEEVIVGDIESLEINSKYKNYFDFIVLADILEHLKEPLEILCRLEYYLKDNGYVILSLPNIANWRMRIKLLLGKFDYEDQGLLDKSHLHFYNVKSAKALISDANLEIVNFDVSLNGITKFAKFFYSVSVRWPNLFAYQFLIIAKKKKN